MRILVCLVLAVASLVALPADLFAQCGGGGKSRMVMRSRGHGGGSMQMMSGGCASGSCGSGMAMQMGPGGMQMGRMQAFSEPAVVVRIPPEVAVTRATPTKTYRVQVIDEQTGQVVTERTITR